MKLTLMTSLIKVETSKSQYFSLYYVVSGRSWSFLYIMHKDASVFVIPGSHSPPAALSGFVSSWLRAQLLEL